MIIFFHKLKLTSVLSVLAYHFHSFHYNLTSQFNTNEMIILKKQKKVENYSKKFSQ